MATSDSGAYREPVPIAPAQATGQSTNSGAESGSSQPLMLYTCQTCARRKVKCDKKAPTCSSCRKAKLECIYQAPRPRKRKLSRDGSKQLQDANTQTFIGQEPKEARQKEPVSLHWDYQDTSRIPKLLANHGKSRYIDSSLWRHLGDEEMQRMSDDEEDQAVTDVPVGFASDPFTEALMGSRQSLSQYHPTHENAMTLWQTHMDNVEPLCKILHIPSTSRMVETASRQPQMASKTDECLLFAIYHFAVFSMTEEDCVDNYGHSRATLLQKYHFACRQSLVNASFLKTTEIRVLQALVLFLLPCRYTYDPHTYWILTGVALRIGQRIGLHRDPEKLGLSPFEVQMRRRLFYQLLPLDGIAGQMSGAGMGGVPDTWDTQLAMNIDDDQIWPGMTVAPEEKNGATNMMFCLARACIGNIFARGGSWLFKDFTEAELAITKAENEVEELFIRYCDVVNPLHFLTMASARAAISAMRLRIRLPKAKKQTATDAERREMHQLAQKIMDTDTAVYAHAAVRKRYQWHVRPFFLWGTWDSFILVVTSLLRSDLLSPAETSAAWNRVEQIYNNHTELLESKRTLYKAFGRLALRAWDVNPPSCSSLEPGFIQALRTQRQVPNSSSVGQSDSNAVVLDTGMGTAPTVSLSKGYDADLLPGSLSDGNSLDVGDDFNVDMEDWMFWDQLIQDDQAQDVQWQE